jgi:hypothetical protein
MKLVIHYTISAVFECISDVLTVVVIGRQAFGDPSSGGALCCVLVDNLVAPWISRFLDGMISLCSQAIGLDEQKLAGEYLQIAVLLSQILYIPQMVFWVYFVEDFILWLGYDEKTDLIGYDFAVIVLVHQFFGHGTTLIFSRGLNFNLEGLVAAIEVGNTLNGMANTFLLLDSDWYYFAALTKKRNKVGIEQIFDYYNRPSRCTQGLLVLVQSSNMGNRSRYYVIWICFLDSYSPRQRT